MNVGLLRKLPWLSLVLLWIGYSVLGWHLSTAPHSLVWTIFSLLVAASLAIALIWEAPLLGALVRMGPRSVILVFIFSTIACLVATLPSLFTLIAVVVAAQFLVRVEMLSAGFQNKHILWALTLTTILGLVPGWIVGFEQGLPTFR